MATRKILKIGNETLRKVSRPVDEITPRILTLLDDMKETLKLAEGAGLAAPQVGVLRRVVVIDVGEGPVELINPEILETSGEQIDQEGCLSIPDVQHELARPMNVVYEATDRTGKRERREAEGFFARAVCHEIDHLNGVLFVDLVREAGQTPKDAGSASAQRPARQGRNGAAGRSKEEASEAKRA